MPRPKPDEELVATAVRLPRGLHERLTTVAASRDVSVNFMVRRAIEKYLDNLPLPPGEGVDDEAVSAVEVLRSAGCVYHPTSGRWISPVGYVPGGSNG